jgi:hypothetical protein
MTGLHGIMSIRYELGAELVRKERLGMTKTVCLKANDEFELMDSFQAFRSSSEIRSADANSSLIFTGQLQ